MKETDKQLLRRINLTFKITASLKILAITSGKIVFNALSIIIR